MTPDPAMHTLPEIDAQLSQLVKLGYRFTRSHTPRSSYSESTPPQNVVKAIVLDTETTGLDSKTERIIELGMVLFEYCPESGQAYRVLDTFNELEDPETPIPPETTKIHNITDDMVRGKRINDVAVRNFIADASLIIAHNAKFDRSFVEARFPFFEQKAWACSVAQIPWVEEGLGSAKLEFLAYRYGFHYDGHRASNDCHALLELLQQELPESGVRAMLKLHENAQTKELKVWALNSPFDSKDALKQRGYRWNAARKTWSTSISEPELNQEADWLRNAVYGGQSFQLELEKMDALNRFSPRKSVVELVNFD
jgi:DNA polymerase-3 subunit epsilon